jgi:integrase
MEVRADRAELPADPKALHGLKLGDLVERYRDNVSIHKRSYEKERFFLRTFLAHPICRKRLSELRTEDFAGYRDDRLKRIQPASLKRELTPIHHMFNVARDQWNILAKQNPLDKLQLKAPDQRRERRLREGELERLIKSAGLCRNQLVAPIIRLAIETGMRRGEILAIRKTQLDLNRRILLLTETKNGHSRRWWHATGQAIDSFNQLLKVTSDRYGVFAQVGFTFDTAPKPR